MKINLGDRPLNFNKKRRIQVKRKKRFLYHLQRIKRFDKNLISYESNIKPNSRKTNSGLFYEMEIHVFECDYWGEWDSKDVEYLCKYMFFWAFDDLNHQCFFTENNWKKQLKILKKIPSKPSNGKRTTKNKIKTILKKQERRRDREFAEYLEERAIDSEINETKAERFQNV